MGSSMNYSKGRMALRKMSDGKARAFAQNIIIRDGKGRYPECFKSLPYGWCPKQEKIPKDPKSVPQTCKMCQEFLKSKFYSKHFEEKRRQELLKRLQKSGMPTRIETKRL